MGKKVSLDDLFNDFTFNILFDRYKLLAMNMFKWEGLPPLMKAEHIEKTLFEYGKAIFVNDSEYGLMCLQANPSEGMNFYGEHKKYYAWGFGYNKEYTIDENSILIRNNQLMTNTKDYIIFYSHKLQDAERTCDVNISLQKTSKIVLCDDKDLLSFKALFSKVNNNDPYIYADRGINIDSFDVLDITAPYVADKIMDYKHELTNELLTFLGINNSNTDKKERLITTEVNANNDFIQSNANLMLECREIACRQINEMFGTSISVKRKIQEVMNSEPVHDRIKRDISK